MWISKLIITNVRSYINTPLKFSRGINVIVGPNNSGKTTILKSALCLQHPESLNINDCRLRTNPSSDSKVIIKFGDIKTTYAQLPTNTTACEYLPANRQLMAQSPGINQNVSFPKNEPNNVVYPYLSKRKVANFDEQVNSKVTSQITGNFQHLYAKIDQVSNPNFLPAYNEYTQACDEIIGFRIGCIASPNGKKGAYFVKNHEHIPLDAMGEGIANLLGLIVDLCVSEEKIFLIEEPENDIHPKALKKLLELIAKKSSNNQFIITTHSNIVTKYLGSQKDSTVISVKMHYEDKIPTSEIEYINTPEKQRAILEELGYEFYDSDMWSGWLFLEESSAERIIRDFLIPMFTPEIQTKLRTYSARSRDEVETKFSDFNNLFVFLHLEPSYKNKAWVLLDAGREESKIIGRLKTAYSKSDWNENRFQNLIEHDFEKYYPENFQTKVQDALKIQDKQQKREAKKVLLEEVVSWCHQNPSEAKSAFEESAKEIIEHLKNISKEINPSCERGSSP